MGYYGGVSGGGNNKISGTATPGLNLFELAAMSGGQSYSLCNNFGTSLSEISAYISKLATEFYLSCQLSGPPDQTGTLSIKVNDVVVPQDPVNGYSYIEEGDTAKVQFNGTAIPENGAIIDLAYTCPGLGG